MDRELRVIKEGGARLLAHQILLDRLECARCQTPERLVRLHQIQIRVRHDAEDFEHLIEHLPMLAGDANMTAQIGLLLQREHDRGHLDRFGAHFGWNHPWNSHWSDQPHLPTAPVSHPLFEGSGTGIIFGDSPQFPPEFRGVFFINDYLRRTTFVWRPTWEGALMQPAGGDWEPFVKRGNALYNPTDIEVGPDGALWTMSWGGGYGANISSKGEFTSEGRVYRIAWSKAPAAQWNTPKRTRPLAKWTVMELIDDFAGPLPVWRIDAQDELVRRGGAVKKDLFAALRSGKLTQAQETWTAWTLGRIASEDTEIADFFTRALGGDSSTSLNLRLQAVRILAHRVREFGRVTKLPDEVVSLLKSKEPRVRFAAVQAIMQTRQKQAGPELLTLLAEETDRVTFYAAWQALRELQSTTELQKLLGDSRGGVRRGALLALLEVRALKREEVTPLSKDSDAGVQEVVALVLGKPSIAKSQPKAKENIVKTPSISIVKNIKTRSQGNYELIPGGLEPGAKPYTDRDYTLLKVPLGLHGADFLQTANADDGSRGDVWLSFETLLPIRVHVALDTRQTGVPAWLREGFRPGDQQVKADHWTFQLYTRDFPAGPVQLGGNTDDGKGGGKSNYIVILEPLPLLKPTAPVTVDHTLDLLPKGNADRGGALFHRGSAGCVNCHRLGQRGNVFAPDLSSIGHRATPRHIVESMLAPDASISEGFKLQVVETKAGIVHNGILLEESGLTLTLGLANGDRLTLDKDKIESRSTSNISAMPSFALILQPQHLADLTAFLLTQKAIDSTSKKIVPPVKADPLVKVDPPVNFNQSTKGQRDSPSNRRRIVSRLPTPGKLSRISCSRTKRSCAPTSPTCMRRPVSKSRAIIRRGPVRMPATTTRCIPAYGLASATLAAPIFGATRAVSNT